MQQRRECIDTNRSGQWLDFCQNLGWLDFSCCSRPGDLEITHKTWRPSSWTHPFFLELPLCSKDLFMFAADLPCLPEILTFLYTSSNITVLCKNVRHLRENPPGFCWILFKASVELGWSYGWQGQDSASLDNPGMFQLVRLTSFSHSSQQKGWTLGSLETVHGEEMYPITLNKI